MKKLLVVVLLLLSAPAFAQQPQRFTFSLTGPELDIVAKALGKMPFDDVKDVIAAMNAQFAQQNETAAKAKAAADKAALDKAIEDRLKEKAKE